MHLSLLLVFVLVPSVLADDDWEDFTNNLATDLAPLITLFGDRLTKQFLSESISLVDNVIFALSPLGVLTTVVSVIRVCGGSSLRAFIGRAQEGPAEAESELLPCVSESTAELFNDRGISRVFGRPKVLEIVAWEKEGVKPGERSVEFGTLLDAIKQGAWSVKGTGHSAEDWCRMAEVGIPNLSLNKGIKRRKKFWFYCVAILGSALQIGVIVYATITVFVFPGDFKKNGKAVPSYAFPFFIIGTTLLFIGMFSSAVIIERSSKEYSIKPKKPSKLYWLQPGNQKVGDQVFGAFLAVKEGANSTMTKNLRYIKAVRDRRFDGQNVKIYLTILFTMLGFIIQFIGLRALHASVILASLGATLLMTILRTCLRTERMAPDENRLIEDRDMTSHKRQELDCFAFHLEGVETLELISSPPGTSPDSSLKQTGTIEGSLTKQLIETRTRLAELTSKSDDGLNVAWDDMPIRIVAHSLARTIEGTMDLMSSWGIDFGTSFQFPLAFECKPAFPKWATPSQATYRIHLVRYSDALRWRVNPDQLEAILGLWSLSLYKMDTQWRRPLHRLVGLDKEEAGEVETYLYFHKWIFRQTEARTVSFKMIDSSRRLFGFNSKQPAYDRDLLAVETENDLPTMAAQDIYIHFLREAFSHLSELGGEVDVSVGPQGSYVAQSSRINELVHCFESCNLGSREDALLCIVPVLKNNRLLPALAADCTSIRKRTENLIQQNDWAHAFLLVEWICKRSVGVEFEYSVYELGHLCRGALLAPDKPAQLQGYNRICRFLESDTRGVFLQAERMSRYSQWSGPLEHQQWRRWWQTLSKQLGWVAWHISINVPGMDWMQPRLRKLNAHQDLALPATRNPDTEETQVGERAMQEWLTMNHTNFLRGHTSEEDSLGYGWALKNEFHLLLYLVLVRWVELGAEVPALTQHAFTVAATCHSTWGIQVLLRRNANIEILNDRSVSPLMEQVVSEDVGGVRLLLSNGADPNGNARLPDTRPLLVAAQMGLTEIAKLLLDHGAMLEMSDSMGHFALYWAVSGNHLDTARFLLSRGADISRVANGSTPLHSAVSDNHLQMVELLLEHGSDVNAAPSLGHTSLMLAVWCSHVDMVHLLLSKGADIYARDEQGLTVLDWARREHKRETVAILEGYIGRMVLQGRR